ncbi:tRNA pseudouridine(55) synthase TruB, partial [Acinetobacter baumannii]
AALDEAAREALLLPADVLLQQMPGCRLSDAEAQRLTNGQPVSVRDADTDLPPLGGQILRAYAGPVFLGLVEVQGSRLRVKRLM